MHDFRNLYFANSFVLILILKSNSHKLYFWRDYNGCVEMDCIIDRGGMLTPIEIKSGETIVSVFFDSLDKWRELIGSSVHQGYVLYGGSSEQNRSKGHVIGWQKVSELIKYVD